jgi:hypothetical protein
MDANNMKRIFVNLRTGDRVASVAQPIAGAIDKTLGTNIKGCGACAKRREKLNNLFNKDT